MRLHDTHQGQKPMNRIHLAALAGAALLAAHSVPAWAHAHLKTASPAPDSTVAAAPQSVAIDFTEGVEPQFSSITVVDAGGHRVDQGPAHIDGANTHFVVGLQALQPGTYTVDWHATAVDTHKTEGKFSFTVKP
jgi:copper resistance protein C